MHFKFMHNITRKGSRISHNTDINSPYNLWDLTAISSMIFSSANSSPTAIVSKKILCSTEKEINHFLNYSRFLTLMIHNFFIYTICLQVDSSGPILFTLNKHFLITFSYEKVENGSHHQRSSHIFPRS